MKRAIVSNAERTLIGNAEQIEFGGKTYTISEFKSFTKELVEIVERYVFLKAQQPTEDKTVDTNKQE